MRVYFSPLNFLSPLQRDLLRIRRPSIKQLVYELEISIQQLDYELEISMR